MKGLIIYTLYLKLTHKILILNWNTKKPILSKNSEDIIKIVLKNNWYSLLNANEYSEMLNVEWY